MSVAAGPRVAEPDPERRGDAVRRWGQEVRDRALASDPGFGRLRAGLSAAVCVGTALPVQLGVAKVLGFAPQASFATALFGAVVAMLGANALSGWDPWVKLRTAALFPVFVGLGLLTAILTDTQRLVQVAGFAVVLFFAVWVRRFGPQWFFYGFMGWMGFFFATFLHASWALVPNLLVASVVSTVWVLLLSTTLFATRPRGSLDATRRAFYARARAVARAASDVLAVAERHEAGSWRQRVALRRLAARQAGLSEAALMADAWLAEPGAVPDGWSPAALRRRLIEAQQAADRMAGATRQLVGADPALRASARQVLEHVAGHEDVAALVAVEGLIALAEEVRDRPPDGGNGWWAARHLAHGTRELLRFEAAHGEPPELDPGEEEFEAATAFVNGNLPGSPSVASDVAARGRWNPAARASMTTRQAAQVALAGLIAIGLGTWLSPTRYYWAVIAAFVMFAGTGSRSETFAKGVARTSGTFVGLIASIALAHATVGHQPLIITVILVSIFGAYYLAKVTQAGMTFFITVLLGQLYTVLGTFSDSLLVLRLGETAVGAVAGTAVALVFAPVSTRDTLRAGRDDMLAAMRELLEACAAYAESEGRAVGGARLDQLSRTLDDRARKLALVAQPLMRPLVVGNSSPRTRRRLQLYVTAVSQCRALTLALQRAPVAAPEATAAASRAIADAVHALAARPPGAAVPEAIEPLATGDLALFADKDADHADDPVVRHLHHLGATLTQVAQTLNAHGGAAGAAGPPRHRASR